MLTATSEHIMRIKRDNALTVFSVVLGTIMFGILLMMMMMMMRMMDFALGSLLSNVSFTFKIIFTNPFYNSAIF